MATKKRVPKPKPAFIKCDQAPTNPTQPWEDPEGVRYLARIDLLELESLRNKIDAIKATGEMTRAKADKREQDAILRARQMRVQAQREDERGAELEEDYGRLVGRLGKQYGFNFNTIGYDDQSGKITPLE